jgi:hypothetical protein
MAHVDSKFVEIFGLTEHRLEPVRIGAELEDVDTTVEWRDRQANGKLWGGHAAYCRRHLTRVGLGSELPESDDGLSQSEGNRNIELCGPQSVMVSGRGES